MEYNDFIWWLGFVVLSYYPGNFVIKLIKGYFPFLRCLDFKSYGKHACITGATDGIGKAYACELASRGMDLIIISRTPSRLFDTATEIRKKYGVEVKIIPADFTKADIYSELEEELCNMDIGVLVNNVGMASSHAKYFWEYENHFIRDTINCNFLSAVMMSRICYPAFVKKKKGIIVNVSSAAGGMSGILASIYSPTKFAERQFTSFLTVESHIFHPNIIVQDLAPYLVATKLSNKAEVPFHVLSPTAYCKSAIETVGRLPEAAGAISHEIEAFFISLIPKWIFSKIAFFVRLKERNAH